MKLAREKSIGKRGLPRVWKNNWIHHAWMCLLPILFIACSSSLGKIQMENVDAIITQSEMAIEQARRVNAQTLASDTVQQAEDALASAKDAIQAKDGLRAMHLAYNALTYAQIAEQEAMYKSQGNGLNAIIKSRDVTIVALQGKLETADKAVEQSRTDIQQLKTQKNQLQVNMGKKLQESEQAHQATLHDYSIVKTEYAGLQSKLDTTQTEFLQAQSQVEEHERQIRQLRRELVDAQALVETARKEAAEAQTRAAAQAQSYSKQIERLEQSNVTKQRSNTLVQKRQAAKAYVQQQHRRQPARTNSTSLTGAQVARGRAAISDWALAWAAKDIDQYLNKYTQDAVLEHTIIRSSNERHTELHRPQMVNALKKMMNTEWQETNSKFDADGKHVVGTYRFSCLSQDSIGENAPALHDVWTREIWVRQVDTEWKIFRESWRVYEAVPRYSTAFN